MMIRLSEWATHQGISYITAFRWAKAGKVPGLQTAPTGRLFVEVPDEVGVGAVLYGRVSSSDQKADLGRQMERLRMFAAAQGLVVTSEVKEIGSGLNGRRKKLAKLLQDPTVGIILVEHRDRLARFGVGYLEAVLAAHGRRIVVANKGEQELDLVQDFIDVVTSMCARIYGRRAAKNRAKRALEAASKDPT